MSGHLVELVGGPLDGRRLTSRDEGDAIHVPTLLPGGFGILVYRRRQAPTADGVPRYDQQPTIPPDQVEAYFTGAA